MIPWEEVARRLEEELRRRKRVKQAIIQECDEELLCETILSLVYDRERVLTEELALQGATLTLIWIHDGMAVAVDNLRARCWFIQTF